MIGSVGGERPARDGIGITLAWRLARARLASILLTSPAALPANPQTRTRNRFCRLPKSDITFFSKSTPDILRPVAGLTCLGYGEARLYSGRKTVRTPNTFGQKYLLTGIRMTLILW